MTIHVMIDNEAMDTSPTAALLQIGAVAFDPYLKGFDVNANFKDCFEKNIDLTSSLMLGCTIDQNTVEWWRKQDEKARASVYSGGKDIRLVLNDFVQWFKSLGKVEGVWSHGTYFDIAQLEFCFKKAGIEVPWKYAIVRDTRTVHWMAELAGWTKPTRVTEHTALVDATAQALDIQSALERLNVRPF